jgi:hypothetical protein
MRARMRDSPPGKRKFLVLLFLIVFVSIRSFASREAEKDEDEDQEEEQCVPCPVSKRPIALPGTPNVQH